MKNQYVGDINDFHKYGLLRSLSGEGKLKTGVCWLLTSNDARNDGTFIEYLDEPEIWRAYDPIVFDSLKEHIDVRNGRDIGRVESSAVLPNTLFHSDVLSDEIAERRKYFAEMRKEFRDCDLVFFDPDNGLEIKSRPIGSKDSSKFLGWNELAQTYRDGHSVLVYQHFIRAKRDVFVDRIATEIIERIGVDEVLAFRTPQTVFLLASRAKDIAHFDGQAEEIAQRWGDQIRVTRHRATCRYA